MPAVVIGPTVAIIGLSLAGNAIGDLQTVNYVQTHNNEDYAIVTLSDKYVSNLDTDGNLIEVKTDAEGVDRVLVVDKSVGENPTTIPADKIHNEITYTQLKDDDGNVTGYTLTSTPGSVYVAIICGLVTLAVTMICSVYASKKNLFRLIPFIVGILAGYACALVFYIIGMIAKVPALMIIDLSPFAGLLTDGKVTLGTFFAIPQFTFLTALGGFKEFGFPYFGTLVAAYVPVAFVVFAEHLADHKNISSIIETDLLEDPGLHRTLLGDGVGSMAGAFFGGCPNTTYGESIGCVAITGNASVITIVFAAVGAILISFLSPFVAFVNSIPKCVMGGVCMALYGFIAVSGLKMVQKVDLEENRNLFVVSVILIAGIGGLAISFGQVTITEVACALILGILTNVMLSGKKKEEAGK
ncbi:MAG: hypothetical protein J5879_06095, partial [Clostridia bacterium]|nr:hypothetical protein [Clostridia bacterium]